MQDSDFEYEKRAALAKRLERLKEIAGKLEDPTELTRCVLQPCFDTVKLHCAADTSGSRRGIRSARRKLALWDELSAKLDETLETNMVGSRNVVLVTTNSHL